MRGLGWGYSVKWNTSFDTSSLSCATDWQHPIRTEGCCTAILIGVKGWGHTAPRPYQPLQQETSAKIETLLDTCRHICIYYHDGRYASHWGQVERESTRLHCVVPYSSLPLEAIIPFQSHRRHLWALASSWNCGGCRATCISEYHIVLTCLVDAYDSRAESAVIPSSRCKVPRKDKH